MTIRQPFRKGARAAWTTNRADGSVELGERHDPSRRARRPAVKYGPARFAIFLAVVLGVPAALMSGSNPQTVQLGKLVMILSPAVMGLLLNLGVGPRRQVRWAWVGAAAAITLAVAAGASAVALAAGAARFGSPAGGLDVIASRAGVSAVTSVLEELGWAGGGLALAVGAFGRRLGVIVLGLVWAAWHLIPTLLKVGLFPELEVAPPAMLVAFVVACLIYRELLTLLRERAGTWLAAAAGHGAPNMLLAAGMAAGLGGFDRPSAWPLFPAPGGLVFPVLALAALILVRRTKAPADAA
jgi:hypothetical protein